MEDKIKEILRTSYCGTVLDEQEATDRILVLFGVMLSEDDNNDCHCFDKCRNPLKDKHCDDSMAGSQYCFEE
tara:strand:- start:16 stop:231 length:216 start_codon:yes stop_codon:yes gene_type:complete